MDFLTYADRVISEVRRLRAGAFCSAIHLRAAYELKLGVLEAAQRLADGVAA